MSPRSLARGKRCAALGSEINHPAALRAEVIQ
jgi:hypothetical protein